MSDDPVLAALDRLEAGLAAYRDLVDELLKFYRLDRPPFEPVTDPAAIFHTRSFETLARNVVAGVIRGRSVTAVRGERGIGKTSLMHVLAGEFSGLEASVVEVKNATQSPLALQKLVCEALGVESGKTLDPYELVQYASMQGKESWLVLLIDDAESQSVAIFRCLQLFIKLCSFGPTKISIVLLGVYGPWKSLDHADLAEFRQLAISPHLLPSLTKDEGVLYLAHKLRLAGQALPNVITTEACAELIELAHGVPGTLQTLTERALVHGHANQHSRITASTLRQALPAYVWLDNPRRRMPTLTLVAAVASVAIAVVAAGLMVSPFMASSPPSRPDSASDTVRTEASAARFMPPGQVSANTQPALAPDPTATPANPAPTTEVAPTASSPAPDESAGARDVASVAAGQASPTAAAPPPLEPGSTSPPAPPDLAVNAPSVNAGAAQAPAPPPEPAPLAAGLARHPETEDAGPASRSAEAALKPIGRDANPLVPPGSATDSQRRPETPGPPRTNRAANMAATWPIPHGGPGLALVAGPGDTMATLYARVYRGLVPPPYAAVVAANRLPLTPGSLVIFPEPPGGWSSR